ncbi:MAG: hypothetical protein JXQ73_19445 [Phycisphaerae bacterium]|nr:hypothetical protein [Phycisphaerae bacterium]
MGRFEHIAVPCSIAAAALAVAAVLVLQRQYRRLVPTETRRKKARRRLVRIHGPARLPVFILLLACATAFPLTTIYAVLRAPTSQSRTIPEVQRWLIPLALAALALPPILALITWRRSRRFFRRLEMERFLICPDCHYSLAGHDHGGHCPECGYTFTANSLLEDWMDVYRLRCRRVSIKLDSSDVS